MRNFIAIILISTITGIVTQATAQPTLQKDYSYTMQIPSVVTISSSPAHFYALSKSKGMAVFRAHQDSLQWLYTSTGMQKRGNTVSADIRFAYIFGSNRRLTVLEPTSLLGVYSATLLPANPMDVKRIGQDLYVAMGQKGLGKISLRSASSVDSTVQYISRSRLNDEKIIDLEVSGKQLFALARGNKLYKFKDPKEDKAIEIVNEFKLSKSLDHIYLVNSSLYGSNSDGNIYEIDNAGNLSTVGTIGEGTTKIASWNDWMIIRGQSGRLWTSYKNQKLSIWKDNQEAGNYFTVTKGTLWLCEYNQISKIRSVSKAASEPGQSTKQQGPLSLKKISDQTVPNSKPLLLPIKFENNISVKNLKITYQSPDINNAEVRGLSFYWQPTADDIGQHHVKLIATTSSGKTDSTTFNIDVSSYNAPPRFAPVRTVSIPVGEEFSLPISATDPDGMDGNLIRFLGVNMPQGASIDETTGVFKWTPTARQVGKNQFRIIATDQYGAAASKDITVKVIEAVRPGDTGN
ncbi:putative Ig domain-containing protein [Fodinibius salinus]|uniref:Putative Ig domain-containing protein n=1 Tax=Fodinibius salinus TaxID=860790 RepID=A0A5D3YH95_9BACT|nr:putative Ig domain-containing protein [Fodinibius salinus]TYP92647.1 putative Ig domain-containing protein [Fodinibius salinus]